MKVFKTLLKRELLAAFAAPPVYVLLACYVALSGILTLSLGGFIDSNHAALNSLFLWQPWLLLLFGAAVGMGQWSEEYRSGAAELLVSAPASPLTLVLSKFTAAWCILACGLLLTTPFCGIIGWLGNPDWGPVVTGYAAMLLVAALFAALGQAASIVTHSQFASFMVAVLLGGGALMTGFLPCNLLLVKWGVPSQLIYALAHISLNRQIDGMVRGIIAPQAPMLLLCLAGLLLLFSAWRLHRRHNNGGKCFSLKITSAAVGLVLFLALCALMPWRMDCTAQKIYTPDPGTIQILREVPQPLRVTLYFSRSYPEVPSTVRRHASEVEELLQELSRQSQGKLSFTTVDPTTTAMQAQAESAGMTPQIGSMGDLWFSGIAIHTLNQEQNSTTTETPLQAIPWLNPDEDNTFEYRLASAILSACRQEPPKIGLISTLPVLEYINPATKKISPTWQSIAHLQKRYTLVPISPDAPAIPQDVELLLLIHPSAAVAPLFPMVNQAITEGKPAILCLDPLSRVEAQLKGRYGLPMPSTAEAILQQWGITMPRRVLADRKLASAMTDTVRGVENIPTLIRAEKSVLNATHPITSHLESMLFFCAGALQLPATPPEGVTITPLVSSSDDSRLLAVFEAQRNPADILMDFKADAAPATMAAYVHTPKSAAVVVADADWLHNSLNFTESTDQQGRRRENAVSHNRDFLSNAADYLLADQRLLRLRSRGRTQRTFQYIEAMGRAAEQEIAAMDAQAYRDAWPLRQRLQSLTANQQLSQNELQEQLAALEKEDAAMQRELKSRQRQVLRQLRLDLDALERQVALLTIVAVPALLALLAAIVAYRRRG